MNNEWVNIDERKPKPDQHVIVFLTTGAMYIDWLDPEIVHTPEPWHETVAAFITHWRPLPPPPNA